MGRLYFRDYKGKMLRVDDERLAPIWERAGELGIPVLIHVSDPIGFFLPIDAQNEHYLSLHEFPGWSFVGSHFSKQELLETRDEYFDYPDYLGRFGACSRWKHCGLNLPDEVMMKVYRANASRVIGGLP